MPRLSRITFFLCLIVLAACESPRQQTALRAERYIAPVAAAPPVAPRHSAWPSIAPSVYADSAIMIDARTGETLYQKNADVRRAVASTQKLLTAMIIVEEGNLDKIVRVERSDTRVEPSKLYLRPGQTYTRRNLLTAMMVKSSNDAAAALARDNAGSVAAFSLKMNRKARELGARSSQFVNPHGLTSPGQFSTARDVARIAYAAYRVPVLREMMDLPVYHFHRDDGRIVRLENTNKLLRRSRIYDGMKTGYTYASGRCLVTSAGMGWRQVILVQLGSKTKYIFDDADRLVRWRLNGGYASR